MGASTSDNESSDTCTREDSDQTAHSRSLIRILSVAFWVAKDVEFVHAENEESGQTARVRRLL